MSNYLCFVIKEKINDEQLPESFVLTRKDSDGRDREINIYGACSHRNKLTGESCIKKLGEYEYKCSICGKTDIHDPDDEPPVAYKTLYGAIMASKLGVNRNISEKTFGVYKACVNISDTVPTSSVVNIQDAWWLGAVDILKPTEFKLLYEGVCKFEGTLSENSSFNILSFTDNSEGYEKYPKCHYFGDTICEGYSNRFTFIKEDRM